MPRNLFGMVGVLDGGTRGFVEDFDNTAVVAAVVGAEGGHSVASHGVGYGEGFELRVDFDWKKRCSVAGRAKERRIKVNDSRNLVGLEKEWK